MLTSGLCLVVQLEKGHRSKLKAENVPCLLMAADSMNAVSAHRFLGEVFVLCHRCASQRYSQVAGKNGKEISRGGCCGFFCACRWAELELPLGTEAVEAHQKVR